MVIVFVKFEEFVATLLAMDSTAQQSRNQRTYRTR